jgi:hypothetical protein
MTGWEKVKGYVDCESFEIIEWDEETNTIYNAVCTMRSPEWPNCNRCKSRVEYREDDHSLLSSDMADLTQADVDILTGSINRTVRTMPAGDAEVKRLFNIWIQL